MERKAAMKIHVTYSFSSKVRKVAVSLFGHTARVGVSALNKRGDVLHPDPSQLFNVDAKKREGLATEVM